MPDRRRRARGPRSGAWLARALAAWSVAAFAVALLVLGVARDLVPLRSGPLAYAAVLEVHLLLLLVPLAAIVVVARLPGPAVVVALVLIAGIGRHASEWVSLPADTAPDDLVVASWNLHIGSRSPAASVAILLEETFDADVVALQEVTEDVAATLEADPDVAERYPFRVLYSTNNTFGMGVISRYPLAGPISFDEPSGMEVVVDAPGGAITLINAHPVPAVIRPPWTFDPARRDRQIAAVRDRVDRALARQEPVLLVGDFNVTPYEPAYRELVDGLRDAHLEAGLGPGWTWRPRRVEPFGIGTLRIDYVFVGPGLRAVASAVDCPATGDHCLVIARIAER